MAVFLVPDFDSMKPSQLLDQHFELSPEDLLDQFIIPQLSQDLLRCRSARQPCRKQRRNQDSGSIVQCDKEQFQVSLEVQQFAPEEVQVKVVDNSIVVEAKHEDKQDEHGFISRQFVRKYVLPEGHDIEQINSSLSSDGVLTIKVPKITAVEAKERVIPITQTGPYKIIKESVEKDKKKEEN